MTETDFPRLALHTPRLIIRRFVFEDSAERLRLIRETFEPAYTEAENQSWLSWCILNYQELARLHQPPYGDYAICQPSTMEVIGSVGLVPSVIPWGVFPECRPEGTPPHFQVSPEFGLFWTVLPAHQGQGFAFEAAQALIKFMFEGWSVQRVVATTERANVASQRVMQKLGMKVMINPLTDPFWFEVVGVLENPSGSA